MPTERPLKVFLSYASQDKPAVRKLYDALKREAWIEPWLDKAEVLPGQDLRTVIDIAIEEADVAIICLSSQSAGTEGDIHRAIRYAYEIALNQPEGTIFLIPVRLDDFELPRSLRSLHPVDYFGREKNNSYLSLLDALETRYEQKLQAEGKSNDEPAKEKPKPLLHLLVTIKHLRILLVIKYLSAFLVRNLGVLSLLIALFVLIFGNNIYAQITGHSIFDDPATPTPINTVTLTPTVVTDTPVPTDTITPSPTFTPVPPTDTPIPTITVIPPVPLGKDWLKGCISTLWRPYPVDVPVNERGDGCWHEPVYVFVAENGDLDFLAEPGNVSPEIYGLFAPLPERGTVTFTVRLRALRNVDLWMGVFSAPDLASRGLLMTIPEGNINKRTIVQKDPRNYETILRTELLDQENGYSISLTFTANSAGGIVNPNVLRTDAVSIPSAQKWLFLGYKSLGGSYRIDGTFLLFELE